MPSKNLLFMCILILIIIFITVAFLYSIKIFREKNVKENFSSKLSNIEITGIVIGVCLVIVLIGWFCYFLIFRKPWNES